MTTLIGILVLLICLFVDQITKALAHMSHVEGSWFLGLVRLNYIGNDGIAYGFGGNNPLFMTFVTIFTVVMILALAVLFFTIFRKNRPAQIALAVVESGAIGNLIDRLFVVNEQGKAIVRDFLDVSKFGFGTCNVADFCITFGAVALVFIILFIGPDAMFPLTKKWRAEAKKREEEKESARRGK